MNTVLITGGAGFVGRRFTRHFLNRGDEVYVVDPIAPLTGGIHPNTGWPLFDPRDYRNFHFYYEDCRDFFRRADLPRFDYALHLAAMVGGRLVIEQQPLVVADDLSIDAAYWQWAKANAPGKNVCFSSSAAYPVKYQSETEYILLEESMIDFNRDIGVPDLSYGWAKLTCEYLAKLAFDRHGMHSVVYRPFSGYGEDQDRSYPFPSICQRALDNRNEPVLRVWGTGKQMRDFIHIDDCVRGVISTMDLIDNADAVNLSTGRLCSFIEFAQIAAKYCGYSPTVTGMTNQPSGVFARGGDTKLQQQLGFTPSISLEEGVKRAVDYLAIVKL